MKLCKKCGAEKPQSDFGKRKRSKDGLQAWCLECVSANNCVWRLENKDRKREYERNYAKAHLKERQENMRKYRANNKERVRMLARNRYYKDVDKARDYANKWGQENREKKRKTFLDWAKNNPQKKREIEKRWCKENPDKVHEKAQRRRAREVGADGSHTADEWLAKIVEYGGICIYCHRSGKMTEDHIVPLSKGGSNNIENIVPACLSCNSRKSDSSLLLWIHRLFNTS